MVKSLNIKGLYDLYDYNISFEEKNPFIITGPNGFGKTTILRIINHLCKGDFWYFYFLVFNSIETVLSDGLYIQVNKEKVSDKLDDNLSTYTTKIVIKKGDDTTIEFSINSEYIRQVRRMLLPFHLRNSNDIRTEDFLDMHYNIEEDELMIAQDPSLALIFKPYRCLIIEEQRLLDKKTDNDHTATYRTVEDIQIKLKEYLQEARNKYNKVSQQVDGTFIQRLSNKEELAKYKGTNNKKLFDEVKQRVELYKQYGLIDDLNIVGELGVQYAEVLRLYLLDMRRKLDATKEYYQKLELFGRLVTSKQLSNKKLIFKGDGVSIESNKGKEIPVQKLSSGEQNLIILCYKLVFELDDISLLLIDEPENSMHMAWLEKLLKDYKDVAYQSKSQMIIATHSPAFIHGNWKLTYDLCEHGTILES